MYNIGLLYMHVPVSCCWRQRTCEICLWERWAAKPYWKKWGKRPNPIICFSCLFLNSNAIVQFTSCFYTIIFTAVELEVRHPWFKTKSDTHLIHNVQLQHKYIHCCILVSLSVNIKRRLQPIFWPCENVTNCSILTIKPRGERPLLYTYWVTPYCTSPFPTGLLHGNTE